MTNIRIENLQIRDHQDVYKLKFCNHLPTKNGNIINNCNACVFSNICTSDSFLNNICEEIESIINIPISFYWVGPSLKQKLQCITYRNMYMEIDTKMYQTIEYSPNQYSPCDYCNLLSICKLPNFLYSLCVIIQTSPNLFGPNIWEEIKT